MIGTVAKRRFSAALFFMLLMAGPFAAVGQQPAPQSAGYSGQGAPLAANEERGAGMLAAASRCSIRYAVTGIGKLVYHAENCCPGGEKSCGDKALIQVASLLGGLYQVLVF